MGSKAQEYEYLVLEQDPPVAVVRLNRPKQLNALSNAALAELTGALDQLDQDPDIAAIVITGGPDVFAAGADLREFSELSGVEMLVRDRAGLWDRVRRVRKPLIAAVSGYALGGGNELAMMCDMIVASDTARFGQPEINVGIMPGAGGTQRLTRTLGKQKAMEMVLLGRQIDAWEAERRGLVNRVVPREVVLDEAKELARQVAEKPAISVRLAKEAVVKAFESTVETGLELERKSFYFLFSTEDAHEGMAAFLEKRKPTFKGK